MGTVQKRLRKIAEFSRAGLNTIDKLKMLIVGYARGHTFDSPGLISNAGRLLLPEISVRPAIYSGLTVQLDLSDLSHLTVAEEIFVDRVYDLSKVPFFPDIIVDCGAHIGLFAVLAASHFPESKLVCFEPDPANYRWLGRQIQSNSLAGELIQAAISIADGEARFEAGRGCGSAFVADGISSTSAIIVKVVDLAKYIASLGCSRLLLKLDVEGVEKEVLPSLAHALPRDCCLFMETHHGEESWSEACRLLEGHGFTVGVTRRRESYTDGFAIRTADK